MKTIVHVSDLHFGRTDPEMVDGLNRSISESAPDLVIISGDFTQRAKESEFQQARAFLEKLPARWLAVPGNHDIRLYDLYGRFIRPLEGYRKYISENLEPSYMDTELTVTGINTARSLIFKGGRINRNQVDRICRELNEGSPESIKILVAHHPLDLPQGRDQALAGRARMALAALATAGIDMILSGHLHVAYLSETAEKLRIGGHTALLIQAGTAISTRSRGEANSFNLIRTERGSIGITRYCWAMASKSFRPCANVSYRQNPGAGWVREAART